MKKKIIFFFLKKNKIKKNIIFNNKNNNIKYKNNLFKIFFKKKNFYTTNNIYINNIKYKVHILNKNLFLFKIDNIRKKNIINLIKQKTIKTNFLPISEKHILGFNKIFN